MTRSVTLLSADDPLDGTRASNSSKKRTLRREGEEFGIEGARFEAAGSLPVGFERGGARTFKRVLDIEAPEVTVEGLFDQRWWARTTRWNCGPCASRARSANGPSSPRDSRAATASRW